MHRRTNEANLGQRCYAWWRPKGYSVYIAGRQARLGDLIEVWHDEPGDRDLFEVCKDLRGKRPVVGMWMWRHRKHLRWKLMPYLHVSRRFDRCEECHRRMNKAT